MNQSKIKNLFFGLVLIFFISCEGEEGSLGSTGLNSLVNITDEPSGTNCENGGIKVEVGIDNNSNGLLDGDEILGTSYICNGANGNTSLTAVTTEPVGINCENGGIKIDSGVDTNGDGTLDDTEITATAYVCNGIDGNNSLTKITSEAAGTNCENGGVKIDTGVDGNSDGILDDSEITATAYACNGVDGNVSLVNLTEEIAGSNCKNGGVRIDSGVDDDGDGTLDDEEIEVTRYICNGLDGGFDEQIRLFVNKGQVIALDTNPVILSKLLTDFDKSRFIGVDSVIYQVFRIQTGDCCGNDIIGNAVIELYNESINSTIPNSMIVSDNTDGTTEIPGFAISGNIVDDIPNESIRMGVSVRSENSGYITIIQDVVLILFRSN